MASRTSKPSGELPSRAASRARFEGEREVATSSWEKHTLKKRTPPGGRSVKSTTCPSPAKKWIKSWRADDDEEEPEKALEEEEEEDTRVQGIGSNLQHGETDEIGGEETREQFGEICESTRSDGEVFERVPKGELRGEAVLRIRPEEPLAMTRAENP